MTINARGTGATPHARGDRLRGSSASTPARQPASAHRVREPRATAQVDAAHVSALGRWIEMLQAQGVNQSDDGLIELRRRRQRLELQYRA
tara:strand:- start:1276 stop:1545 length:270 start_codon:yes stop_codon:yes gene_type:complete